MGIGFGLSSRNWWRAQGGGGAIPSFALNFATISDDFTFTRSSFATRVNEFGLIETVTDLGSDLVRNGDFEELGSELVTNGSFDTDSDWNINDASITIGDGTLNFTNSQLNKFASQGNVEVGKTYKVQFTIVSIESGSIRMNCGNEVTPDYSSAGTYTNYLTASNVVGWYVVSRTAGTTAKIDNVSVKQVDPNDEWSLGTGWSIADGVANGDGTASAYSIALQSSPITSVSGTTIKLEYTISNYVSGVIRPTLGIVNGLERNSNGTFVEYIDLQSNSPSLQLINRATSLIGSIDNIVVQEVLEDDLPRIDYTDATFDVPVLGDELIVNGSFDTDSNWVKGTGWSIEDGKAKANNTSTNLDQSGTIYEAGKTYQVSYDINKIDESTPVSGSVRFRITGNSNENGTLHNSEGTYVENIKLVNEQSVFRIAPINFTGSIDNVSVKEVTAYTTTDKGSFLLEPQSTNLLPYSEDFSQWFPIGSTSNLVSGVAPNGNTSVYELTSVTQGKLQGVVSGLSVNTEYTFSFYVKQLSSTTSVQSRVLSQTGGSGGSNLTEVNYQDQLVTDKWVRITHTFTTDDTLGNYIVYASNALTVGESLQFWGAQVEELTYATSYIPTNGSIATRSAESCVDATPTINSEEGVIYAEINTKTDATDKAISISDSSASNRVWIGYSTASKRVYALGYSSNTIQFALFKNLVNEEDFVKVACKYKENDFSLWVNGVKEGEDTTGLTPLNMSELSFNVGTVGGNFYGNTKDLKIYDKALTDEELITLTTI